MGTYTHTFTETIEERYARLIQEALDYGESRLKNKSSDHLKSMASLKIAHALAEQDIRAKGGV